MTNDEKEGMWRRKGELMMEKCNGNHY